MAKIKYLEPTLKAMKQSLPRGFVMTKTGEKGLSRQMNAFVEGRYKHTLEQIMHSVVWELEDSFEMFFSKSKMRQMRDSRESDFFSYEEASGSLTSSNPTSMWQEVTGELMGSTGFFIALDNVIVYRKHGGTYAMVEGRDPRRGRLGDSPKALATARIDERFQSLGDSLQVISFQGKDRDKFGSALSLHLFSAAPHSTWVHYGLGQQRKDGKTKRGTEWFNMYEMYMFNAFNSAIRISLKRTGLKLRTSTGQSINVHTAKKIWS